MVQNTLLSKCTFHIPTRFVIAIMIFGACFCSYMLRVNMSINLIAMVQPTRDTVSGQVRIPECSLTNNQTLNKNMNRTVPDYGPRYYWDQKTQGLILGAYFWGYIITQIPGGLLAEKYGARHLIGCIGIVSALLTMLIPITASLHYGVVIVIRFLMGIANGALYPALHAVISRWAAPGERGRFTGALLGGSLGTVVTWPLLGAVAEALGWHAACYIPAALCLGFTAAWYRAVYHSPAQHPGLHGQQSSTHRRGFNGALYPALHAVISRWAAPSERGRFTGALLGGSLGTVVTWPLLGAVAEALGWHAACYIPAALCLGFTAAWYRAVYHSPAQHPRIQDQERKYIEGSIGSVGQSKNLPPYGQILRSPPFISLMLLHFGNCWGLSLLLTTGPKYLAEVLGFRLSGAGGLAALPYLARIIMAFVFGAIGDHIRTKNWMTVTSVRKWFVIFSHFIPGVLLLIQPSTGCNVTLAILLITLSLGFNGACTITNIQNAQDLAPNFAGTLYGIVNCAGATTGFITPMLAGYITQNNNGLAEWRIVFTIGAIVYIATGIVFCIFGSGEVQPWNEVKTTEDSTNQGCDNNAYNQSEDVNEKSNQKTENNIIESTKV